MPFVKTSCIFLVIPKLSNLSFPIKTVQLGREVLDEAAKIVKIGVTTDEIDRVVHQVCLRTEKYLSLNVAD